jgi:hypothetical protein
MVNSTAKDRDGEMGVNITVSVKTLLTGGNRM